MYKIQSAQWKEVHRYQLRTARPLFIHVCSSSFIFVSFAFIGQYRQTGSKVVERAWTVLESGLKFGVAQSTIMSGKCPCTRLSTPNANRYKGRGSHTITNTPPLCAEQKAWIKTDTLMLRMNVIAALHLYISNSCLLIICVKTIIYNTFKDTDGSGCIRLLSLYWHLSPFLLTVYIHLRHLTALMRTER